MMKSKYFPYLIGAAALAAVLIAVGAPLASLLPFAIVLACPGLDWPFEAVWTLNG
jgi:hypothetical protein